VEDVDELIENLEGTGSFSRVLSVQESFNTEGLLEATVEGIYLPPANPGAPEAKQP
jgi:hypothetical protein